MKSITILSVCAASLAISACSDPKEASEGNFKTVINSWIEQNPPCISVPRSTISPAVPTDAPFPRYVDASPLGTKFASENRMRQQAPFDAMVDAGLLKVSEITLKVKTGMFGDATKDIPVRAFDLTSAGQKALSTTGEKSAFGAPAQNFCYGKPSVIEVNQFTEPADIMGVKASQVSYSYRIKDLPDWVKNEKMQAAFPRLAKDSADSIDAKAALILTNKGWVHEKAAKL